MLESEASPPFEAAYRAARLLAIRPAPTKPAVEIEIDEEDARPPAPPPRRIARRVYRWGVRLTRPLAWRTRRYLTEPLVDDVADLRWRIWLMSLQLDEMAAGRSSVPAPAAAPRPVPATQVSAITLRRLRSLQTEGVTGLWKVGGVQQADLRAALQEAERTGGPLTVDAELTELERIVHDLRPLASRRRGRATLTLAFAIASDDQR